MTSAEFSLWIEEYRRSPWGEERDGLHAAIVAKTVADYAGKVRNGSTATLSEFLLDFDTPDPGQAVNVETEPDPIKHFQRISQAMRARDDRA